MSAANESVLRIDVGEVPRAVARATKRDNILYPLSAFFMLLGCFLIVLPHIYEFLELAELLALFGVITAYEGMVIATIAYIARRAPDSRDLPALSFIELLFLLDATFTVNACLPVSTVGGPVTVMLALLFAYGKIFVMHRTMRLGVYGGVLPFLLPSMAFLYLFQIVFQWMRGASTDVREVSTYFVYLVAGGLVFLLEFVEARQRGDGDDRPAWLGARWRRTVIGVALAAVGVQLTGQSWVHQVPFSIVFLVPIALSLVVAWPRRKAVEGEKPWQAKKRVNESLYARAVLVGAVLVLAAFFTGGMVWETGADSLLPAASPFRISLLYATAMLLYLWRRERSTMFVDMAFVTLALAALGASVPAMATAMVEPGVATMVAYALVAGAWLVVNRSHRRAVIAATPLLVMACAYAGRTRWEISAALEFLRYWPVVAFGTGLVLATRDRALRVTLAAVMFVAGVAAAGVFPVSGLVYACVVLAAFLAAAFVEHRAYGIVAGVYVPACVARAYAAEMPTSSTGWGVAAIIMAFVLFALGIHITRSRLRRGDGQIPEPPRTVPNATPDALLRVVATVCVLGLLLAAIPSGKGHYHKGCGEASAVAGMMVTISAQTTFHKTDFYGKGELVYANARDGRGLPDLYELADGTKIGLIDRTMAGALPGGVPKGGYVFTFLDGSVDDGPYDPRIEFGMCAVPAIYNRTGRNMFVMDTGGTIYQTDSINVYPKLRDGHTVRPLKVYPSGKELEGKWIAVGY